MSEDTADKGTSTISPDAGSGTGRCTSSSVESCSPGRLSGTGSLFQSCTNSCTSCLRVAPHDGVASPSSPTRNASFASGAQQRLSPPSPDVGKTHGASPSAGAAAQKQDRRRKSVVAQVAHARKLSLDHANAESCAGALTVPSARSATSGRCSMILSHATHAFDHPVKTKDEEQEEKVAAAIGDKRISSAKTVLEDSFLTELHSKSDLEGLILPFSRLRTAWDFLTMLMVLYTAIWLPMYVVHDITVPMGVTVWEMVVDLTFLVDILLNFRTAYVEPEGAVLVVDKKKIASKYASKWLPIDVCGSIPWEIIFFFVGIANGSDNEADEGEGQGREGGGSTELLNVIKILKLPKLLRLGRFFKILERIEGAANVGRIVMLMCIMTLFVHWISCVWFLIARADGGWLRDCETGACLPEGLSWFDMYLTCFYSSLMMVMGDGVSPQTNGEHVFASIISLLGACMNAVIFANVAALVAQMGEAYTRHKLRMDAITEAMRSLRVTSASRQRIRAYFEYCWVRHRDFAANDFFSMLPLQLRKRITVQVHAEKLRTLPLFAEVDGRFLASLSMHLAPEVFLPDEYILVAGLVSSKAYFIERGRVQMIHIDAPLSARKHSLSASRKSDARTIHVRDDYFGEQGLFLGKQHKYSVRAMTHVDTYSLERLAFEETMKQHPSAALHIADHVQMGEMMPSYHAKRVAQNIYEVVGMRDLLECFMPGKWRPKKGLAAKIRALLLDSNVAPKIRRAGLRSKRERLASHGLGLGGDNPAAQATPVAFQDASFNRQRHVPACSPTHHSGAGAGTGGWRSPELAHRLAAQSEQLSGLASAQARLEARIEELVASLGPMLSTPMRSEEQARADHAAREQEADAHRQRVPAPDSSTTQSRGSPVTVPDEAQAQASGEPHVESAGSSV